MRGIHSPAIGNKKDAICARTYRTKRHGVLQRKDPKYAPKYSEVIYSLAKLVRDN